MLVGGSDERDMITVPPIGDDERDHAAVRAPARALVRIIRPRVEEILEMVRDRLEASSFAAEPRGRVDPDRRRQPAHRTCRNSPRNFRPAGAHRPAARHRRACRKRRKGPAFAAAAGLLVYPQAAHLEHFETRSKRFLMTGTGGGYFARVGQWLRESF